MMLTLLGVATAAGRTRSATPRTVFSPTAATRPPTVGPTRSRRAAALCARCIACRGTRQRIALVRSR